MTIPRSLLFVPGDRPDRMEKAAATGADALILDLEDSVSPQAKPAAREAVAAFLSAHVGNPDAPLVYVRINARDTGLHEDDIDAVVPARPQGIVLPKACGGADVSLADAAITVAEAMGGIEDGTTRILPIATETGASLFVMGSYAGCSQRLDALTWGAEDLSADVGASANRAPDGTHADLFRLARALTLAASAAAGVAAIDTVFTDLRDPAGLRAECDAAARDGFVGKMAIHPAQVAIINAAFTPSPADVAEAQAVVEAFAAAGTAGVISLGGRMLDRPHLYRAERIVARAAAARRG